MSSLSCTGFLHNPSCKFMATAVASFKSLQLDLCAPFYVADDSEWRERRQISLWKKEWKSETEKDRGIVRERGDRSVQRLNLETKSNTHQRRLCLCTHISHSGQKESSTYLGIDSFSCYLSYSLSLAGNAALYFVCLFSQFSLLAGFMTHQLPVLLHLQAHIFRSGIKQNGSVIKRLWQLSSHTS